MPPCPSSTVNSRQQSSHRTSLGSCNHNTIKMTSTLRHPLPQLRIIQQQFVCASKRPHSSTAPVQSAGKAHSSEEDDDEYDDPNSRFTNISGSRHSSSSEPPTKVRKKPGRKPNPASPAVRKEQNRAAQRAFRDRKERHLHEMESTIMELQKINSQITERSKQDAERFKAALESLQSENYYLRQVVFSFEAALSKGGNVATIQQVKAELYDRHYEKHTAKKRPGTSSPTRARQPPVPVTPSVFLPDGNPPFQLDSGGTSQQSREQILDQAVAAAMTTIFSKSTTTTPDSSPYSSGVAISPSTLTDPEDNNMFSLNNNVFYKAAPLFPVTNLGGGKLVRSTTPFESLSVPRSFFTETGAYLAKRTEYTKNGSVFDELQSSLFSPGTLESIVRTELATPQEIVNDISLLDQLHDSRPLRDPVISPGQAAITFSSSSIESSLASAPTMILDDEDSTDFEIATPTLGLDDDLKQDVIPSKRLHLEIQVLASAPPAVDLSIDPKIYALPHDPRIDLIPCPRLRAQLILHQKKYNIDELGQLLLNGAICHGHPLDPHSWELPETFFDKYGFLLGEEMLRHRNKIWPKKDEPQLEASKAH